jgi:hypothetical protein
MTNIYYKGPFKKVSVGQNMVSGSGVGHPHGFGQIKVFETRHFNVD